MRGITTRISPENLADKICEMGDEDGCAEAPVFWVDAPTIWVKSMLCCQKHADEMAFCGLLASRHA